MLSDAQKEIVDRTYRKVAQRADEAGALLYNHLFELAPQFRPLFKQEIEVQGRKLIQLIGVAVASVHDIHNLEVVLGDLGRKHVDYGVEAHHYEVVGQALLLTLQDLLPIEYDDEVELAWKTLYQELQMIMIPS